MINSNPKLKANTPAGTFFRNETHKLKLKPKVITCFFPNHPPPIGVIALSCVIQKTQKVIVYLLLLIGMYKTKNNEPYMISDFPYKVDSLLLDAHKNKIKQAISSRILHRLRSTKTFNVK